MDLITQLPETLRGHSAIIVFVDRLTKMVHLAPATTSVSSQEFAQIFLKEVYAKHGMPKSIVSDRDPRFTSDFFREFCRCLEIEQNLSTAFHPQTDGQTERMNHYVETILRAYVNPAQEDWDVRLPLVEFAINNAYQSSVKSTPFFLNYGEHPRTPADNLVPLRGTPSAARVQDIQTSLRLAKASLKEAQQFMARFANRRRRDLHFDVGDFVLLHSKNLRLQFDGVKKLMHRYFGPFKVLKRVGPLAYELELPTSMKIHDVFHVSLLKLYKKGGADVTVPPPALLPSGGVEYEVENILAHRVEGGIDQFLISWKGDSQNTWLDFTELNNCKEMRDQYCVQNGITLPKTKSQRQKALRRSPRKAQEKHS
jgi:hypothetical protein